MSKQTKKEIEETLRNKLTHKFNQDVEHYRERISSLSKENNELYQKLHKKNNEVLELKDKVEQYEDWIRRLQEFCDLPDDEREKAIKAFRAENEYKTHMKYLMDLPAVKMFTQLMSIY